MKCEEEYKPFLKALYEMQRESSGNDWITPSDISKKTGLEPCVIKFLSYFCFDKGFIKLSALDNIRLID